MSFQGPPLRQLPACDACYAKKTRCDRNDPCFNCVAAKIACLRHRPRQTGSNRNNPANDRIDVVLERMSRLEESLRRASPVRSTEAVDGRRRLSAAAPSTAAADAVTPASEQQTHEPVSEWLPSPASRGAAPRNWPRPLSRKRSAVSPLEERPPRKNAAAVTSERGEAAAQSPEDRVLASLDLNRYLRSAKASTRTGETDPARQSVLESAIWLAKQAMSEPDLEHDEDQRHNFYESSMYPGAEFIHLLLHARDTSVSEQKGAATPYFLDLFASCTSETLERMALALVDCTAHGQQRIQYVICVNHAAYCFITALDSNPCPGMRRELLRSKKRYRDNIVMAVGQLDTAVRPDVSLLYALQSGAQLMQDIGRMRMCWKLNTLACRVGAALRGRSLAELGVSGPDDVTTLRLACIRSYIFDTALSANNYQPACLARMDIDRSVLDSQKPGDAMLSTLLSFSEVQEIIIHETRRLATPGRKGQMDTVRLARLKPQMMDIRAQAQEYRARLQSKGDAYLQFEWQTIDFMYYSMMTTITRLSSTGDDPNAYEKCLENARKCLYALRALLELTARESRQDRYVSSLAWVIPLFPLRPLYFVFSNIIETSDSMDLKLLQDISQGLEGPAKSLHSIMEIQHMCISLLDLYADYAEKNTYSSEMGNARQSERARPTHPTQSVNPTIQSQGHRRPPCGPPVVSTMQQGTASISAAYRHQEGELSIDTPTQVNQDFMMMGGGSTIDQINFDQQVNWELFFDQPTMDLL